MKNIKELRDEIGRVFYKYKRGKMTREEVMAFSSLASKMLGTVRAQLLHSIMRGEMPDIPFLKEDDAQN